MPEMTTHERMTRMYGHREADRVPVTDSPWSSTVERWRREGMPEDVSHVDYFRLDRFVGIGADNSPRFPEKIIEETDECVVRKTKWGATVRNWRHAGGVPEFLDFTVTGPDAWREAKKRITPDRDRVDWERLERNYARWREEGAWISAGFWFGFDVTHAWMVGTERVLMAMAMQPEWISDAFNHLLDVDIALFEMVWDEGYEFDEIRWPDDMGYKGKQFFSLDMYRDLLKPAHGRAADWAHAKGVKVQLHSCGCVAPMIPDLIDLGIDMLNPIEVKSGMDPARLKAEYGDRLCFHGGLNAALFTEPEKLWHQMRETIPAMKVNGGYVASSDHSVPESVSLEEFRTFVELAKELGAYG